MTAYDNDDRVKQADEYQYMVNADGDEWMVSAWTSATKWYAAPCIDGRSIAAADLRTREETEGWLLAVRRGPFGSADEAIYAVIGDPQ